MRRSTRDWLTLAMCLATVLFAVSLAGFLAAHFTVRPLWAERLSEVVAILGLVCLLFAVCAAIFLVIKRPTAGLAGMGEEPSATVGVSTNPQPQPKISRLAILSLVLGAPPVSCLYGVPAVAGFILGIVALHRIHTSEGRIRGTGLAIAGTVLSFLVVSLVVCGLLFVGPD
jgi:hypothetical protein